MPPKPGKAPLPILVTIKTTHRKSRLNSPGNESILSLSLSLGGVVESHKKECPGWSPPGAYLTEGHPAISISQYREGGGVRSVRADRIEKIWPHGSRNTALVTQIHTEKATILGRSHLYSPHETPILWLWTDTGTSRHVLFKLTTYVHHSKTLDMRRGV